MKRIKRYLCNSTTNNRRNHCMVVYLQAEDVDKMKKTENVREFIENSQTNIWQILSAWVLLSSNIVMYLYRGRSTSTPLGKGRGVDKKRQKWHRKEGVWPKKWCSHKIFYVIFPVTESFFLGFSWSSDSTTASNKRNTSNSNLL